LRKNGFGTESLLALQVYIRVRVQQYYSSSTSAN
jgi:hypothetical protein